MKFVSLLLLAAPVLLSGCAIGPTPQNAQEYREAVTKGGYGTKAETYEVKGSYGQVAATVKAKSAECFNRTLTTQECRSSNNATSCTNRSFTFIPRFTGNGSSSELAVLVTTNHGNVKNVYLGGPPPEDGMYVAVADLAPAGAGTKVSVYSTTVGFYAHIPKAIKHWTSGTNLGCPDFAADL
jgi:hypothetical protein